MLVLTVATVAVAVTFVRCDGPAGDVVTSRSVVVARNEATQLCER